MTVAAGQVQYNHGNPPCSGVGLSWASSDLEEAMSGPVATVLFDDAGRADIRNILTGLAETEFEQGRIAAILNNSDEVEDWRVGEAIAETYLTEHRSCMFPWPDGRDERKSGSSLPGADLVGFCADESGDCLAFGEVKTSSEAKYPPGAMYGRTGLKQQMEDLRDRAALRDDLLKYLCYRATSADWRSRFEAAGKRYLHNSSDVRLYGVLIRDVNPNADDLRVRVQKLTKDCPNGTRIELLALYLPAGSINGLGQKAVSARTGGSA